MMDNRVFLEAEVDHWRRRAEEAENRLKEAASFFPPAPPEPPIGTRYTYEGAFSWRRCDDGWHCAAIECRDCPTDWGEVWDRDICRGGFDRELP